MNRAGPSTTETVVISVDGNRVEARKDEPILWAALRAGIYIPNMCAVEGEPHWRGACRLCWVSVKGREKPVCACAVPVSEGMVVDTGTEEARVLRKRAFDLLMAAHDEKCKGCKAIKTCELLKVAKQQGFRVRARQLSPQHRVTQTDERHDRIRLDPGKCILCGKCIHACHVATHSNPILTLAGRGPTTRISTFEEDPLPDFCSECLACVRVCPAGGVSLKSAKEHERLRKAVGAAPSDDERPEMTEEP